MNEAQLSAGDAKAFAKSFKQMLRDIGVDPKESDYETMLWDFASSLKFDPKFDKIPDWSMADSIAGEFEKLIEDIYGMLISDENIFAPRLEENLDGIIQNLTEEFRMKSELFGKGTIVCKRGKCKGSVEISGKTVKVNWLYDEKMHMEDNWSDDSKKYPKEFTITFNGKDEHFRGSEKDLFQGKYRYIKAFRPSSSMDVIRLNPRDGSGGFNLNDIYVEGWSGSGFKIKVTKWGKTGYPGNMPHGVPTIY